MIAEKRGQMTHFTWEHVPDTAAVRTAAAAPVPGPPSAVGTPRRPGAAARPGSTTRRALTQVRFQFLYSPELQDSVQLNVGALAARPPG